MASLAAGAGQPRQEQKLRPKLRNTIAGEAMFIPDG